MKKSTYQKILDDEKELNKNRYQSVVEEYRRVVRVNKIIKVNDKDLTIVYEKFLKTFRDVFNLPNVDFLKKEGVFMIQKFPYIIEENIPGKIFSVKTSSKKHIYKMIFKFGKTIFGKSFIKYTDYTKGERTAFGMATRVTTFFYKNEVKKNAKSIKKTYYNL